jgi:hypothetical protein
MKYKQTGHNLQDLVDIYTTRWYNKMWSSRRTVYLLKNIIEKEESSYGTIQILWKKVCNRHPSRTGQRKQSGRKNQT